MCTVSACPVIWPSVYLLLYLHNNLLTRSAQ
jgi:hypothetical protein